VRPDKSVIGPPMPSAFYRKISDDDLAAIIAYLRAQSAVKNEVPRSKYDMPLPPNYGSAIQHVKAPSSASKLRYGEYLANIGHCMECHTPRDSRGMLVTTSLGAGGQLFKGPWGESISRNLTPDETGLKNWTDEQVIKALREGVDRNGQPYKPPMAFGFYRNISDADMGALLVYLRSLKAQPLGGKK
jgi:mono/diheme cytochrome c family protein